MKSLAFVIPSLIKPNVPPAHLMPDAIHQARMGETQPRQMPESSIAAATESRIGMPPAQPFVRGHNPRLGSTRLAGHVPGAAPEARSSIKNDGQTTGAPPTGASRIADMKFSAPYEDGYDGAFSIPGQTEAVNADMLFGSDNYVDLVQQISYGAEFRTDQHAPLTYFFSGLSTDRAANDLRTSEYSQDMKKSLVSVINGTRNDRPDVTIEIAGQEYTLKAEFRDWIAGGLQRGELRVDQAQELGQVLESMGLEVDTATLAEGLSRSVGPSDEVKNIIRAVAESVGASPANVMSQLQDLHASGVIINPLNANAKLAESMEKIMMKHLEDDMPPAELMVYSESSVVAGRVLDKMSKELSPEQLEKLGEKVTLVTIGTGWPEFKTPVKVVNIFSSNDPLTQVGGMGRQRVNNPVRGNEVNLPLYSPWGNFDDHNFAAGGSANVGWIFENNEDVNNFADMHAARQAGTLKMPTESQSLENIRRSGGTDHLWGEVPENWDQTLN